MAVAHKNLKNWLAALTHPRVGPVKFKELLQADPELDELPSFIRPNYKKIERALKWLEEPDNSIITLTENAYPLQLKKIHDPPPLLFVKGRKSALKTPQLAIVGSRNASSYGMKIAEDFSRYFASIGISITSGLAVGIDAASHKGVLQIANGCTIAVVANGLDIVYPKIHSRLSAEICAAGGAIVSENMPGTEPLAGLFPRRNRIISGLSLGVLIVEAACNSGSLITAKLALEQGREVFAIPGGIHNTKAKGCNQLIKQGAKLVETAEDILEELGGLLKYAIHDKNYPCKQPCRKTDDLSPDVENVLDNIGFEPTALDKLMFDAGQNLSVVNRALVNLELNGMIKKVPGGYVKLLN